MEVCKGIYVNLNKINQIRKRRVARVAVARSKLSDVLGDFLRVDKTNVRRGEMEEICGGLGRKANAGEGSLLQDSSNNNSLMSKQHVFQLALFVNMQFQKALYVVENGGIGQKKALHRKFLLLTD